MKKSLFAVIILALSFAGCSKFLTETPSSFVDRGSYYKSEAQCRTAVNSCYVGLRTVYSTTLFTHLEGTTDICYVPSISDVNAILDINPSQCNISKTVWSTAYKAIMYCNAAIAGVENSTSIEEGVRNDLLAEAKTMRAFWYYLLTGLFGDVPYYTDDVVDQPTMDRIAHLGRMDANATRAALIRELQECYSYNDAVYTGALSQTRANDAEVKGRAGWAMGMMLIGKMAMWNAYADTASGTDWFQTAIDALEHLVPVYGELSGYPLSDLYFSVKDTPEVIFEIRHAYSEGTLSYAGTLAQNCMPSYNSTTQLYDGVNVPWLGTEAKVGACNRPSSYFYAALQPDNGQDKRVDINQGRRFEGTPFSNGLSVPWMGPKFWCPYMKTTNDSNNYPVLRYADALLLLAEAYCAKQDKTNTEKYLNMVRSRAGLPAYVAVNWAKAAQEIRDERARELFGEFQRKFDLVRWGIWYDTVREYWIPEMDKRAIPVHLQRCHRYLPIPIEQVVNSGYALDNKEYNAYGM
ncbi:MAG: RagB/SusD family nutrient uptake outer membrane protein [Bacteroidales bacterium]|nr:RagB/SusD family nutrient uptake outer membrane protein [Bacteroidales bacterium]